MASNEIMSKTCNVDIDDSNDNNNNNNNNNMSCSSQSESELDQTLNRLLNGENFKIFESKVGIFIYYYSSFSVFEYLGG